MLTPDGDRVLVRTDEPDVLDCSSRGDPLGLAVRLDDVAPCTSSASERTALPEPPRPPVLVRAPGTGPVITLDRPERRNAIDLRTAAALEPSIDAFEADRGARRVLTGAGGTFCAGHGPQGRCARAVPGHRAARAAGHDGAADSKPVIVAVEGNALAGGCELALVADLVVAATDDAVRHPRAQARPGRRRRRGDAADASGCRATSRWSWR